jgi:hypothetical protein
MSLSREFFTSSPSAQDEVIRVLARKAIELARAKNASARDVFDRFTRGLLHAKHATGAPADGPKPWSKCWSVTGPIKRSEVENRFQNRFASC